jgi:hypothetical protein
LQVPITVRSEELEVVLGLNVPLAPAGSPSRLRLTEPLNPYMGWIVTV